MALVILGRRVSSGRPHVTSIAAELPIVVFGPAALTFTGTAPSVAVVPPPEWLPEGAVEYANFADGHYYVGGVEVAVTTAFGNDPATVDAWGTTSLDTDDIGPDGLAQGAEAPALIGALKTDVLDGATLVLTWNMSDAQNTYFMIGREDGSEMLQIGALTDGTADLTSFASAFACSQPDVLAMGPDVVNRIAVTLTSTHVAISGNGAVATASAITTTDWPAAGWEFAFFDINAGNHLVSFEVYAPQLDAALPALSTL